MIGEWFWYETWQKVDWP